MLPAADGALHCAHRTERAPDARVKEHAEDDANAGRYHAHQPEDAPDVIEIRRVLRDAKSHKTHQRGEDRPAKRRTPDEARDGFFSD